MSLPADDLVAAAQRRLGRAVGRARAGEDRELAGKVREGGEALANVLAGLVKMTRVHAAENHAFDAPAGELSRITAALLGLLGTVHLVAVEDQVYLNEVRVREGNGGARELGAELARHNAGGLTLHAPLAAADARALVAALGRRPAETSPRGTLQRALAAAGVRAVELLPRYRWRLHGGEEAGYDPAEAIGRALELTDETYENLAAGRVLNPLPLRRVVARLLEVGPATPDVWEHLADGGTPHAQHAVSVALVALLVGRGAGLSAALLQDLGLAALVHDAGYAAPDAGAAPGAEGLARHPPEGARMLLRQRGFHAAKLRRLRAVLDHHRDHADGRRPPSPLGAVLRLGEDYATLARVYAGRASRSDVLGAMAGAAGRLYDPALVQVMVNALGRFPPGTLLELEDGRHARSVSPVRSPETFATPLVRFQDLRTRVLSAERHDLARGPAVRRALPG